METTLPKPKKISKKERSRLALEAAAAHLESLGLSMEDLPGKRGGLSTSNGNDIIDTPDELALAIVHDIKPSGHVLEPCAGGGAFVRAFHDYSLAAPVPFVLDTITALDIAPRCGGIKEADFFDMPTLQPRFDWIITNPPWSIARRFLIHAMKLAHNVVFLDKMNAWTTEARLRDMVASGFCFRRIALVDQPPPPWPQMGFQLAVVHISLHKPEGYSLPQDGLPFPELGRPLIYPLPWKTPASPGN